MCKYLQGELRMVNALKLDFEIYMPRIIFGLGSSNRLLAEITKRNGSKIIFITDKSIKKTGLIDSMVTMLKSNALHVEVYDEVEPEPSVNNAQLAVDAVHENSFDLVVGIGGGSVLDISKLAASLGKSGKPVSDYLGMDKVQEKGLPLILIPTTAGTGSEVTWISILKEKENNRPVVVYSKYLLADLAILDPALLLTLPPSVTANTGLDALAHAIEACTCTAANPVTDLLAYEAINLMTHNLRTAVFQGGNIEAREKTLLGSVLAGIAFANSGLGAVHALAYPFGIKYRMAHGFSNGIMLPWVMKHNYSANLQAFANIAQSMNVYKSGLTIRENAQRAVLAVKELALDIGIPQNLGAIGLTKDELAEFPDIAIQYSSHLLKVNPKALTKTDIMKIYEDALYNNWDI
jgi:alcohol dehydrogenase class IV